ncbi:MAG: tyrosine-type recombinase/integrase [Desulfonatronovibrionaceae bacterium]
MALTDVQIKNLTPGTKTYKRFDEGGLFIEVRKTGKKFFRFKFTFGGKYQLLSLGEYPAVSLKLARDKVIDAKRQLAEGINPAQVKREQKQSQKKNTLEDVAFEWFKNSKDKWSEGHAKTIWRRVEKNLLPWLKNRPVQEITTREILEVLRKVEARGAVETAHRLAQIMSQVYIYAVAAGIAENNPVSDISKALKPVRTRQLPAITEPERIKDFLRAIDGFQGTYPVLCALRLAPLVFLRPGELRKGKWSEIDWQENLWIIPAERMKKKREHLVPLSSQARGILEKLYPLTAETGNIFPAVRKSDRCMSEATLNAALLRIGIPKEEHCPHGFRTMASTRLHEMNWPSPVIEMQLAHIDKNQVRAVYNRAEYLDQRRNMMQAWADYLDALKAGGKVLSFSSG